MVLLPFISFKLKNSKENPQTGIQNSRHSLTTYPKKNKYSNRVSEFLPRSQAFSASSSSNLHS
jgi:hypothetical protein